MHPLLYERIKEVDEGAALFLKEHWRNIDEFNTESPDLGGAFIWMGEPLLGSEFWSTLNQKIIERGHAKRKAS